MEINDMATMLGVRMKNEPYAQRFVQAREAYTASEELRTAFAEYKVQQMVLQEEANKEEIDNELVKRIDTRIEELYDFITKHPVYAELAAAEEALNQELKKVMDTITAQITGVPADGCTHDCSSCGGCH